MRNILCILFILLLTNGLHAQGVGINETGAQPDNSAVLDVSSSSKGMLIPRLTSIERNGIISPATGLMVYDTNTSCFWYYDGTQWIEIGRKIDDSSRMVYGADRLMDAFPNDDNYKLIASTNTMSVNSGDMLKVEAYASLRLNDGSGNDDFYIYVQAVGSNGCTTFNCEEVGWLRPSEANDQHDNFRPYTYLDAITVGCTGDYVFNFYVRNTGDDGWEEQDGIIVVTKY